MRSVAFCTLGCKVNQYETDAIQERFEAAGYEVREFSQKADVYIVNTCTVTNIADRKSRQMLHRARKKNPDAIVAAVGCYVETSGHALDDDNAIDILIGNDNKKNIVDIINRRLDSSSTVNKSASAEKPERSRTALYDHREDGSGTDTDEEGLRAERIPAALTRGSVNWRARAYVKIQDGCNQFCSYCIIPYARGRVRSRDMDDIVAEAKDIVSLGYREIVVTGIHISSYGVDLKKKNDEGKSISGSGSDRVQEDYGPFSGDILIELLERLSEVDGLKRIRLGSLEPRIITEPFLRRLQNIPQICPHFHLSLQSGCDSVLKRMNRHYTADIYYEKCRLLRSYFDRPAITTDIIVGFPGETDEEFRETLDFAKKTHFSAIHVFKYSRRSGTRAAVMPDQIDPVIMAQRSDELLELARGLHSEYVRECADQDMEVLIEERSVTSSGEMMTGYSRNYIRCAFMPGTLKPGDIVCGKVNTIFTEGTAFCEECR